MFLCETSGSKRNQFKQTDLDIAYYLFLITNSISEIL